MEILIVCVVMFVGVVYGYYTVNGSGIAEHRTGTYTAARRRVHSRERLRPRRERLDEELVARHALTGARHYQGALAAQGARTRARPARGAR